MGVTRVTAEGGGGVGGGQRNVRWGRSLCDGNAELVVDCIQLLLIL